MLLASWSLLLLLSKLLSYIAFAGCIGAGSVYALINYKHSHHEIIHFTLWLRHYFNVFATLGFVVAVIQLPIQSGALAEAGFAGMFDQTIMNIIWQSPIGTQSIIRAIGFIALLSVLIIKSLRLRYLLSCSAALLLAYSFTLTGHTEQLAPWVHSILLLHLLAMAAWVGSLLPLYQSCRLLPVHYILILMQRFGQVAQAIVGILLLCGFLLLWQLVGSITLLFTSNYGQLLLFKLLLVVGMLLLAAWHKFNLVVALANNQNPLPLRRSILIEACLAILILITTSIFTTLVGPETI